MTEIETIKPVPRELACLEEARRLIAECMSFDDLLKIRDHSESVRSYLRMIDSSLEAQNDAAEIKVRAERRIGEMLAEMPRREPGRTFNSDTMSPLPRLEDLGITKKQSSRWQAVASIDEQDFENQISELRSSEKEITTASFLRLAKKEVEHSTPEPWTLYDVMENIRTSVFAISEKCPRDKLDILAYKLISLGNELLKNGELRP